MKGERDISVHGDQAEQVCSEDMQTSREEKADQAEQASSGERDQPLCDQAEHLMCREKQMNCDRAELTCSTERGQTAKLNMGDRDGPS